MFETPFGLLLCWAFAITALGFFVSSIKERDEVASMLLMVLALLFGWPSWLGLLFHYGVIK